MQTETVISRPMRKTANSATMPRLGARHLAAVAVTLSLSALLNQYLARRSEAKNTPSSCFLGVDGVQLHYAEFGNGPPLVLLHGNGSMIEDFTSSGLVALAARSHRVIVFDRPGYGHSTRPKGQVWDAAAQADLINSALGQIGVEEAIVLGHSWGASVAVALASRHPETVRGLVLASGYYYPTPRLDIMLTTGLAIPIVGDILRYTILPLTSRLMWPLLMRKIFGPAPVPAKFSRFPVEMAVRPSQLRASAAESALLIPMAAAAAANYSVLAMPVVIVAGSEDRLINPEMQSEKLHNALPHSTYHCILGSGHMVHQTDSIAVMQAVTEAFMLAEDITVNEQMAP